jgi:hypothetical protein
MLLCLDKKILFFLVVIFSSTSVVIGQINSNADKKLFSEADKAFYEADYLTATKIYEYLLPKDTANSELNYKIGVCKFELKKYRKYARKYFEKVEVALFPEANYYLGLINHTSKDFQKAISCFNKYKNSKGNLERELKEVEDLIEKCYTARYYETSINNSILIENLGKSINTEYPEYSPLVPADEKFILFTSRRKNDVHLQIDAYEDFYEDIYISQKKENEWQLPTLLDTSINTSVHDACTGLSADGEKLLLFRTSKDLMSGDIYESSLINGQWSNPQILGSNVNSNGNIESSACYSKDNDLIVFSSNRIGGYGGLDLYMVRKLDNGNWGEPFNLGPQINTEYNEDAPFLDPLGTTLYFSSQGHKNMGGYDVFKTPFFENGKFVEPENMGTPINTVNDDIFFVLNADGSKGYLSSERDDSYGSQDIYCATFLENTSQIKPYNLRIFDTEVPLNNIEILVTVKEKRKLLGVYKSNFQSGKVLILINPDNKYDVTVQVNGFETLQLDSYSFGAESDINLSVKKLKK